MRRPGPAVVAAAACFAGLGIILVGCWSYGAGSVDVTVAPPAAGAVELSPPGGIYPGGTVVTLTATPNAGYVFSEWDAPMFPVGRGGGITGTENPIQVTVDMDRWTIARFIPDSRFTVNVNAQPAEGGSVTVEPAPSGGTYAWGTGVTLTAEPASGYVFGGWSGDAAGLQNPAALEMKADKVVTAVFTSLGGSQFALTVEVVGADQDGVAPTVTASPSGGAYDPGTVVTLAPELNGYTFDGWQGDDGGGSPPETTVTMDADKVVTLNVWYYSPPPICQAHKLLDEDSVVRVMAEELLLMMGERELGYMDWAAREVRPDLAKRIREVMTSIREGARPDPLRWPARSECVERLWSSDGVAAIMAAQMLRAIRVRTREESAPDVEARVVALLDEAGSRSLAGAWRR